MLQSSQNSKPSFGMPDTYWNAPVKNSRSRAFIRNRLDYQFCCASPHVSSNSQMCFLPDCQHRQENRKAPWHVRLRIFSGIWAFRFFRWSVCLTPGTFRSLPAGKAKLPKRLPKTKKSKPTVQHPPSSLSALGERMVKTGRMGCNLHTGIVGNSGQMECWVRNIYLASMYL